MHLLILLIGKFGNKTELLLFAIIENDYKVVVYKFNVCAFFLDSNSFILAFFPAKK